MMRLGIHHILIQSVDKYECVGIVSVYDISKDLVLDSKETFPWVKSLFKIERRKKKEKMIQVIKKKMMKVL